MGINKENQNDTPKITIKEIARLANVSTATVSRVINNPEAVSEKLRDNVQRIIDEYKFVPSQLAKNFFSRDSKSIAVFVYDIENPFFSKLIGEFNRVAFDKNYTLIICDTQNDEEREVRYLKYLESIKVSGLILTEGASKKIVPSVKGTIPMVLLDRTLDNEYSYPLITSDNLQGAHMAVEHLVKMKHRRIAYVGGPKGIITSEIRKTGYLDIMKKYNLEIREDYIYNGDFKVKGGVKALDYFISLEDMPTAVFCANDLMAQGFILRANSLNLSIPRDFSIVGFDGVSLDTFYPKLTTVKQDIEKIVSSVMDILVGMIEDKDSGCKSNITKLFVPSKLVIGETCRMID